MDVKWIVDEQMNVVANGGCKFAATSGILNSMLMAEVETIQQYQYAKQALIRLFADDEAKAKVLAKMIDNIIEDEEDHAESFNKAAAIINGHKEPKATEYNEAVKSE